MAQPKEDKDAESESPESRAFEDALKQILATPKARVEEIKKQSAPKSKRTA